MDDLLSKLDEMWEHYEFAYKAHNEAKTNDGREFWFRSMGYGAMDICNFLIEHDATVTFATPEPSAATVAEPHWQCRKCGSTEYTVEITSWGVIEQCDHCPYMYSRRNRSDATSAGSE